MVNSENMTQSGKKWGLGTVLEDECFETSIPALLEEVLKAYKETVYARACQYVRLRSETMCTKGYWEPASQKE